jgi:hypothetical protein
LQLFLQTGHRANFAISPICRASFAKSKERTRAAARFPVLKEAIPGKQCSQSKLVISHCNHKDSKVKSKL